jgi:hypothetical protein
MVTARLFGEGVSEGETLIVARDRWCQ